MHDSSWVSENFFLFVLRECCSSFARGSVFVRCSTGMDEGRSSRVELLRLLRCPQFQSYDCLAATVVLIYADELARAVHRAENWVV